MPIIKKKFTIYGQILLAGNDIFISDGKNVTNFTRTLKECNISSGKKLTINYFFSKNPIIMTNDEKNTVKILNDMQTISDTYITVYETSFHIKKYPDNGDAISAFKEKVGEYLFFEISTED